MFPNPFKRKRSLSYSDSDSISSNTFAMGASVSASSTPASASTPPTSRGAAKNRRSKCQSWTGVVNDAPSRISEVSALDDWRISPIPEDMKGLHGGLSDVWSSRILDYQFLSGDVEPVKEKCSMFVKTKSFRNKSRRYAIGHGKKSQDVNNGYQCANCKMIVHKSCLSEVNRCQGCPPPPIDPRDREHMNEVITPHRPVSIPLEHHLNFYPEYLDLLQEYPWWAERMSRESAESQLWRADEGTFLLRWSERHRKPVLSLRANGEMKHMKVNYFEDSSCFYLSEARYFSSIPDLIKFYRFSPLSESFNGLDCVLHRPVYDLAIVRFRYDGTGPSHLSLRQNDRVVVLSREGESRGWWKGRIGSRVGYFPKEYVTTDHELTRVW